MDTVLYHCPFVPPEWIAAHGFIPSRPIPPAARAHGPAGACPFAQAFAEWSAKQPAKAVVYTTTCDQMRRMGELARLEGGPRVFLMHVPSSWQAPAAREGYRQELERLGRFLVALGGAAPSPERLTAILLEYEARRQTLRARQTRLKPPAWIRTLRHYYGTGELADAATETDPGLVQTARTDDAGMSLASSSPSRTSPLRPAALGLVGSPLLAEQLTLFEAVEAAGGEIVLDGTTNGELALPPPYAARRLGEDPMAAMVELYFQTLPDAFRRPNTHLYEWLPRRCAELGLRGVLFHHQLWCDTWHAEAQRLKEALPIPLMSFQTGGEPVLGAHALSRIQAFLENLP